MFVDEPDVVDASKIGIGKFCGGNQSPAVVEDLALEPRVADETETVRAKLKTGVINPENLVGHGLRYAE